jgi:hypothetical protein
VLLSTSEAPPAIVLSSAQKFTDEHVTSIGRWFASVSGVKLQAAGPPSGLLVVYTPPTAPPMQNVAVGQLSSSSRVVAGPGTAVQVLVADCGSVENSSCVPPASRHRDVLGQVIRPPPVDGGYVGSRCRCQATVPLAALCTLVPRLGDDRGKAAGQCRADHLEVLSLPAEDDVAASQQRQAPEDLGSRGAAG